MKEDNLNEISYYSYYEIIQNVFTHRHVQFLNGLSFTVTPHLSKLRLTGILAV